MRLSMRGFQHFILLGVLLAFLLTVSEGPASVSGRLAWLVGCGLFLLWQPLVSAERRLSLLQTVSVLAAVAAMVLWLDWVWLVASMVLLASLVGGKVIVARERRLGWFYLLSFALLCVLLFVWGSPRIYGDVTEGAVDAWSRWLTAGALVLVLVVMPWRRVEDEARVFDFLVSLLVLLVLSSVLMAVGILVAIRHLSHVEALIRALLGLGGAVLALSWIWNPRLGFGGFGSMVSRYLLRLGFPFEDWLRRVSDIFDQEADPEVFLDRALASMTDLPWVVGGVIERGHGAPSRSFGAVERHQTDLSLGELRLTLFTSYGWSASLIWQANLLFKLVVEFYRARQRERLLRQLQYVQAVYETGSRVTHDVKNLLQSMEGLCFALQRHEQGDDGGELVALMRRQLPVISQRLRATLDKLMAPSVEESEPVLWRDWWDGVQQRYLSQGIAFAQSALGEDRLLPRTLFDNVLDNLIANALQKRAGFPALRVAVTLEAEVGGPVLRVSDDGAPVDERVMSSLFGAPVPSASGLGVGLFHAARLASRLGYRLELSDNRPGSVVFVLRAVSPNQSGSLSIKG